MVNLLKRYVVGAVGLCLAVVVALSVPAAAQAAKSRPAAAKASKAVKATKTVRSVKAAKSSKAGVSAKAAKSAQVAKSGATNRSASVRVRNLKAVRAVSVVRARPSFGQLQGLHQTADPLDLKSSVAFVMDQQTDEVLINKNAQAVLPIASITKLMTALVVTEAHLPPDELITITQDDVDTEKGSRSRLVVGTSLSRDEMLHLALMASENRAAHALGRTYPGGLPAAVAAMNRKALSLGMFDTSYVEPTGLSSRNQSSAQDLAVLVKAAYAVPLIRQLSTSPEYLVDVGNRQLQFRNTNGLVKSPLWDIGVQKTGYISEAGRCLVMQVTMAGRQLIMVFLDSAGRYSRIGDAERVRRWVTESQLLQPGIDATIVSSHPAGS